MPKVRINDLAEELEEKSKPILDALEAIGVTGKTHSSSIDADQAERVRDYFKTGSRGGGSRPAAEAKPKFDLSHVSKPGDALRAILERKSAEAAAKAAPQPQRPAVAVAAPRTATGIPSQPTAQTPQSSQTSAAVRPAGTPVTAAPVTASNAPAAGSANVPGAPPAPRRIVPLPRQGANI